MKARAGLTRKMAFPRVIPHSDGAGEIDAVGDGVPSFRLGEPVWILNAQWRRAFGTCAEYVTLPAELTVRLPDDLADWLDSASRKAGVPRGRIIRDQLQLARKREKRPFLRLAGFVEGPRDLSTRKGFSRT